MCFRRSPILPGAPFSPVSRSARPRSANWPSRSIFPCRAKIAQKRQCALRPEPLKQASEWIDQYRAFWEGRLDALAGYLDELKDEQEGHDDGDASAKRRRRNRRG
jgi:hypothetical protein